MACVSQSYCCCRPHTEDMQTKELKTYQTTVTNNSKHHRPINCKLSIWTQEVNKGYHIHRISAVLGEGIRSGTERLQSLELWVQVV